MRAPLGVLHMAPVLMASASVSLVGRGRIVVTSLPPTTKTSNLLMKAIV
jgi:hypothetical protein